MAVYVTDTHPLVWYVSHHHGKLSKPALRIFSRAERGEALVYVPAMVMWECGMIERIGRFKLPESFQLWMRALLAHPGFDLIPLDADIIEEAVGLQLTRDLFDVSVIATARIKGFPVITNDQDIIDSKLVDIAW